MASIQHSIGSLLSSFESLVSGLLESVLAIFRHFFNIIASVLKGTLNLSEEVLEDAWKVIEGSVRFLFGDFHRRQSGCNAETGSAIPKDEKVRWASRMGQTDTTPSLPCTPTANFLPLVLVAVGAIVGLALANRQTGAGQKTVSSAKGSKKRA